MTNTTYSPSLSGLTPGSSYQFYIAATNSVYAVAATSAPVTLTVAAPSAPSVWQQPTPSSASAFVGQSATFVGSFTGSLPITYQWLFSADGITYNPVSGGTNITLVLANLQLTNSGSYELTASNYLGGPFSSAPATLSVTVPLPLPPAIRNQYVVDATNSVTVLQGVDFTANAASADGHSWVFTTTPLNLIGGSSNTTFSGDGVMEAVPNTGINEGVTTNGPQLQFQVNFPSPTTNYIWVRGIGDSSPGPGQNDAVVIGLDGAVVAGIGNGSSFPQGAGFAWAGGPADTIAGTNVIVVTNSGVHVLDVWMQKDGFDFDRILLTTLSNYTPTGVGAAESPIVLPRTDYNWDPTNDVLSLEAIDFSDNFSPVPDSSASPHSWVLIPTNGAPDMLNYATLLATADTNWSAGGLMESDPNINYNAGNNPSGPRLDYPVMFSAPGTYIAWVRGIGNSPYSGSGASDSDSILIGIDRTYKVAIGNTCFLNNQGFTWGGGSGANATGIINGSAAISVPVAGLHTINAWMREDGFDFEKLILTTNSGYIPTDVGPPESPQVTAVLIGGGQSGVIINWIAGHRAANFDQPHRALCRYSRHHHAVRLVPNQHSAILPRA